MADIINEMTSIRDFVAPLLTGVSFKIAEYAGDIRSQRHSD